MSADAYGTYSGPPEAVSIIVEELIIVEVLSLHNDRHLALQISLSRS